MVNDIQHNRYEHSPLQNPNSNDSHHAHLRLALGSILSPKRSHNASSVSGTASPAPFSHYHGRSSNSLPEHNFHPQPGTASRTSSSTPDPSSHISSPQHSPRHQPISNDHADKLVQEVQSQAAMSDASARPPLVVVLTEQGVESQDSVSGQRTPSGRFIATLQSKSAWDALIHGSMV